MGDLGLTAPYTVADFITAANQALGCSRDWRTVNCDKTEAIFSTSLADGANFEGHESLREALNDIAEITQSIYYINYLGELTFKRLSKSGTPNLTITESDYIKLISGSSHQLAQIVKTTELGNNINGPSSGTGNIQHIRDNAFYELLPDSTVGSLLNDAMNYIFLVCRIKDYGDADLLSDYGDFHVLGIKGFNTRAEANRYALANGISRQYVITRI